MDQQEIKITYGEGRYKVNLYSVVTCDGISVTITGGERPHIGGMVLSIPRKSLSGSGASCDKWVCPVPGHKDTEVAAIIAELVSAETGKVTAVVAGMHIDNAEQDEITRLVENSIEASRLLLTKLKRLNEWES